MAGLIGIAAAARALERVVCPHCGKVQARARDSRVSYRVCGRCHKRIEPTPGRRGAKR